MGVAMDGVLAMVDEILSKADGAGVRRKRFRVRCELVGACGERIGV